MSKRKRATHCRICGAPIDNSDTNKPSSALCVECHTSRKASYDKNFFAKNISRRPTVCRVCGKPIDNSDPRKKSIQQCNSCKAADTVRARTAKRQKARKENLLALNAELLLAGRRICGVCLKQKTLTEFSNKRGQRATCGGDIKKICDSCYVTGRACDNSRPSELTVKYLRMRAYSLNKRALQYMHSITGNKELSFDDLPFMIKPESISNLLSEQGNKCHYCRTELSTRNLTVDHKNPLSRNKTTMDSHDLDNLVAACRDCNSLKSTRTEGEFNTFVREYSQRILALEQPDKEPVG